MARQKEYKVGIYVRLSKEDSRGEESVSIENQKMMLTKYVRDNGWTLTEIYQDDGFSGTNQNRPAFRRMIAHIKSGHINTILIKDLSRLGRNYLEVGSLTEIFLPEHGCELISLSEKLDDMMVFRNWFNEQHSKTTSQKVKAGKRAFAQSGKYVGAYAPYGYIKEPRNRHKLIIDENTAPIVTKIFQMRAKGMGFRAIAEKLNNDGIIPPREYYYQNKNAKNPVKTRRVWGETTVKGILKNEAYIGNLVYGKQGSLSYKNQKLVKKSQHEWIKAENTHEPIIPQELWDKAQAFTHNKHRPRRRSDGEISIFAGLLYCACCGYKLRSNTERRTRKDGSEYKRISYMCSTYANNGKKACTVHGIGEKPLIKLVTSHMKNHWPTSFNRETIINAALAAAKADALSCHGVYTSEMEAHKKHVDKLDLLIENLYHDKVSGLVPDTFFKRQVQKYERERTEREQSIRTLEERITNSAPIPINTAGLEALINQGVSGLCIKALLPLVEKIIVHEAQYITGQRICDIQIMYKFGTFLGDT
ncbi:MAG: recombinase family protein [Firmicutes bacterium]|nr:recombinase family protein [Bacillota bacterium]